MYFTKDVAGELKKMEDLYGIKPDSVLQTYLSPPWYHKRLPFHVDISLSIGSTMFDFCFWQLPEVLSIGIFWIHLDIQVGGLR